MHPNKNGKQIYRKREQSTHKYKSSRPNNKNTHGFLYSTKVANVSIVFLSVVKPVAYNWMATATDRAREKYCKGNGQKVVGFWELEWLLPHTERSSTDERTNEQRKNFSIAVCCILYSTILCSYLLVNQRIVNKINCMYLTKNTKKGAEKKIRLYPYIHAC